VQVDLVGTAKEVDYPSFLREKTEVTGIEGECSGAKGDPGRVADPVGVRGSRVIEKERAAVFDREAARVAEPSVTAKDKLCTAYLDFTKEVGAVLV